MDSDSKTKRKQNPGAQAGTLSSLLFLYMIPIFRKNYKNGLTEEDLYEALDEHKSSKLGDKLQDLWEKEYVKHKKSALHRALLKFIGFDLTIVGILKLFEETILIVVMPVAIGGLVSYFDTNTNVSEKEAYFYAAVIISVLFLDVFVAHPTMMLMMHTGMKMRIACCSLIYRKSLRLNQTALAQTTVGQIVNLLSNDVSRFDQGFLVCHYVWIAPVQTVLATYLLYKAVGAAAFSGIGFLLLFIPLQFYLGNRTSMVRLQTALRTDERVRLMNEILSGIQVIKMYTWEKPFAKLISFARRCEIKAIREHSFLRAIMFSLEMFMTRTSVFITLIVFICLGNNISADTVYAVTAVYNVIRPIITVLFSISISSLAEIHISISRFQQFLCYEEAVIQRTKENDLVLEACNRKPKLSLQEVYAKWFTDSSDDTLTNISLSIDTNQLIAVIGPVGSGKSSLLNTIIKELTITNGSMDIRGNISYASQEAWLFTASIRQNILFGEAYDENRYNTIIKMCALESDLEMLPYGDRTVVGEKGRLLSGGQKARVSLARCVYKQADIYLLDDPLSAVDTKVGKKLYKDCIKKFLHDKICILVTHQLQYLRSADKIIILKAGKIVDEGTYDQLQVSGLDFAKLLQEFQFGEEQEDKNKLKIRSRQNSEMSEEYQEDEEDPAIAKENVGSGHIAAATYGTYFRAGGSYSVILFIGFVFVSSQVAASIGDYYVSYWVNLEQKAVENGISDAISRNGIAITYTGITIATIVFGLLHSILYFEFLMRASVTLHKMIFEKVSYATMQFFNTNPTGRILNRFSKDMGIIDEYIPFILIDVIEICLLLTGTIVLTSMVNPWLILPSTCLLLLFYFLRIVCLETSRGAKRIEGIARTPIFSQLTASIQGLSTIRAFSAQDTLIKEFDKHQDFHSSAWYMFISASRAFGLWLDVICITFISLVTISLLAIDRGYYGGEVGLVITQYLNLIGILSWGMRQWTELENHMISVERVLEYTKIETEPSRPSIRNLSCNWPELGKIIFQSVSMRYRSDEPHVLKNLNFTIYPREKIGIVGRTGAGKTSIIAALFQLYDVKGSIVIDDVDITKLPLEQLRSKISIIPQDPVLFSGTMRKNLDPFEEYDDDTLWNALKQVELKDAIADTQSGLDTTVVESGSNFSVGQRQLVCLARAIIRNNKILVLDEATANVDPHTDALIQKTIRKNFTTCTVITVAHRLHTIMDSDRVLVMDAGRVVELDHPHSLLQNTGSVFYNMVQTTGQSTSKQLASIAEESFTKLKNK